ncbi:MAG: SatD family protein, partial [Sulfurimonas sp.]|nr:SatD family protein [Sulfurimonas sp.]
MNYILMGDIIDSREQNSKLLWEYLNEIVEQSNIEFKQYILSPLQIKIGDEFQVVMKDIQSSLKLLYYMNTYLMYKKIESRFVIGYGSIE